MVTVLDPKRCKTRKQNTANVGKMKSKWKIQKYSASLAALVEKETANVSGQCRFRREKEYLRWVGDKRDIN